jgi:predicted  nucleic acid-binding Zn-ribbon protein
MSIRDVLVGAVPVSDPRQNTQRPTTLEAHHQQKMKDFQASRQREADLEKDIANLENQIAEVAAFSDEARELSDRLDQRQRELDRIRKDEDRLDYFLNVGDMLFQYYDAQDGLAKGRAPLHKQAPIRMPANSVLSYFSEVADPSATAAADTGSSVTAPARKKLRASEIDSTDGLNRDKMLERYLAIVEPSAIKSGIMPGSGIEPGWGSCPRCDVEMTFYQNEALLGCPRCGNEEFILVDSEKPSYKDPPREITYFAYKKINHFNEWLAQFQAKENTDIPQDVIESVMRELRKERISDPKKVKKEKIREILQKLKLSKMYDHVQQIKNRIQHQMTNLTLSKEMEEKLQYLFKEIQPAFIKYCPPDRSNFLSYPYVLYKLCQLLEMDEFLPCFQLLKSREKLYQQDQVWEKICREMQWQFIRSI